MFYEEHQICELQAEFSSTLDELQALVWSCISSGQEVDIPSVQEHMIQGAGRRISTIRRAISNIYESFPPNTSQKLLEKDLFDVEINLQAFFMNLYGVFDNFAWAYILRHDLRNNFKKDKQDIGMFSKKMKRYLPKVIQDYLSKTNTEQWFKQYLKLYRDFLAHRVPLYIPPFVVTTGNADLFNRLESERLQCLQSRDSVKLAQIENAQNDIVAPCFFFDCAYVDADKPKRMQIHPQILSDAKGVIAFGTLFLANWHKFDSTQ